ncbi:WxL domain-containing protein [Isobaculum melis]
MKKVVVSSAIILATTLLSLSTVQAAEKNYPSEGIVEFKASESITPPVDPTDPTKPINPVDPDDPLKPIEPGTQGPLSIDFASPLNFGRNEITNKDVTYYANALVGEDEEIVPNYVQISDNRGTSAGWTLSVKQNGQFTNKDTKHKVLTGAEIVFEKGTAVTSMEDVTAPTTYKMTLDPAGASVPVMSAKVDEGEGLWLSVFGSVEDIIEGTETIKKNKAISLSIPGKTPKDAVKYTTSLTWTLSDVPGK